MLNYKTKSIIFVLLFSCIMIVPVYAQEPEPTPTPRPTTTTILTEVSDSVQTIGILNFVSAGIVILVLVVAYKGLAPLIKANSDANQRATEANKTTAEVQNKLIDFIEKQAREMEKINEIRRAQTEAMERTALAQEATVKHMNEIETRKEALERSNTQVDTIKSHTSSELAGAAETINKHTDESVGSLRQVVEDAVGGIGEIKEQLQATVKVDDLENILSPLLKPIVDRLDEIANQLNTAAHKEPVAVEAKVHITEGEENKSNE
jgi:uncharacterized protein YdaU (DUF1376 family)